MALRRKVYFPPRLALSGTLGGNLIQQLEFRDHSEELDLIAYNKRGVSGWTVKKENGESILIVGKKTTAKFDGSILLIPDVSTHAGSDIKEGISRASTNNRVKSNLFTRGYEEGEKMTIGASHKGRIWSHRIAKDIPEWFEWCKHIGKKLLNSSILTEKILEQTIIPEVIHERPNLVPLTIDWSPDFYAKSDEAILIEIGNKIEAFYLAELAITTFTDTGSLGFCIRLESEKIDYEIIFNDNSVEYIPMGHTEANIIISDEKAPLSEWFQENYYPIITFEDTSELRYNEMCRSNQERKPYDASKINCWNWNNVDLRKESQYKADASNNTLILRKNSIQRKVIDSFTHNNDVVFDDDGAGEIADIVTLKVSGDNLLINLFHCKYSKSETAGVRVGDLYEVCGQAQKSVFWRNEIPRLFQRLRLREQQRQKSYNLSRFEKGNLQKLEELRRRSRFLHPKFHIYIVQPGLAASNISPPILDLLGATELYLLETFNVPLKVIASS